MSVCVCWVEVYILLRYSVCVRCVLREDADGLQHRLLARRTLRRLLAHPLGAVEAEEVVAARHQSGGDLLVAAHDALAAPARRRQRAHRVGGRRRQRVGRDAARRQVFDRSRRWREARERGAAGQLDVAPDGGAAVQGRRLAQALVVAARPDGAGELGQARGRRRRRRARARRERRRGVDTGAVVLEVGRRRWRRRVREARGQRVQSILEEAGEEVVGAAIVAWRRAGVGVGAVEQAAAGAGAHGDVRFDLAPRSLHALGQAGDFEDGLLVARRRHDVGVRLVLDALDGGALGPDHQAHHSVRHAHLDGHVAGHAVGRGAADAAEAGGATAAAAAARRQAGQRARLAAGADLREVLGGREDFAFGLGHVLLASGHHEHWLLAAHRSLDVGVGLGSQRLNLATCNKRDRTRVSSVMMLLMGIWQMRKQNNEGNKNRQK